MTVDKLTPDDPRVERKTANLNGRTYGMNPLLHTYRDLHLIVQKGTLSVNP